MSGIEIRKIGITELDTDAIVNAANEGLWAGGGVCGAIFRAAGAEQLQTACSKIGHCETGSAVITPGFNLKSEYIIHAVGPRWKDGQHGEPKLLYGAYMSSLRLAVKSGCKSIGFPLISSGIFGYPVEQAWRKAIQACRDFLAQGDRIDIVFAVLDDGILRIGRKTLKEIAPQYSGITAQNSGSDYGRFELKTESMEKLKIAGREEDVICFHLPSEPNGYLSNWYLSSFELDGIRFSSAEQYIMYQKCMLFGDKESAGMILATDDPAEQQAIGKDASGYIDKVWDGMRQLTAVRGLLAKFSQNEELKEQLLATGDAWLVECARKDVIWACGFRLEDEERLDASKWRGKNILGFALMEVRNRLKGKE